jgi:hexosaminidase
MFLFAALFIMTQAWSADSLITHNLMPVPADVVWNEGSFKITSDFNVMVKSDSEPRVENAVKRFIDRLAKRTGLTLADTPQDDKPSLSITFDKKGLPFQSVKEDESYHLVVTTEGIKLSAPNPLGVLHGLQTLLQLVEKQNDQYVIPCVAIHDNPRFAWRGLLIDVARHWMPVEVIKRNLDGLEEAKMNVFHWHLSEDQGFRVESKLLPKLQELGSDGNFYTQDQIRDIIAYARDRGIRVVPEFDIPGHTTALLSAYPELGSAPGPNHVEHKFGVFDPTLDPANKEVYTFLSTFIGEMAGLFPDEYFHIGGDEVSGKEWNANNDIQRFMYKHHLKTNEDLQTYFNSQILPILTKNHKKMEGWDEILNPKLPKTIMIQSWRGLDSLAKATQQGYDAILSKNYYLDLQQPAAFHYANDPIPADSKFTPEQISHLLGGEACMWSEHVTPETIDSRVWPRTLAIAERLWSPASVQDVDDMYRRLYIESAHLDELGLTHNSNYLGMLEKLVGQAGVASLKVLADVSEPLKDYQRHRARAYTSLLPFNRLVDATRPESETARLFSKDVDQLLETAPHWGDTQAIADMMKLWAGNHKILAPYLEKSDEAVEAASQSEDLSTAAQYGLEALKYLKSGQQAPQGWQNKAKPALIRALKPHADITLAVVMPICKLALAACELDKLKDMKPADWNKSLNDQMKVPPQEDW